MNIVLEILTAFACIANVAMLLLEIYDRCEKYRHQRMDGGEDMEPSGH